ncbi:hypothetical protein DWW90_06435 [Parabacteroides sp. AF17-28]|nr:hypothetical protein DWW90_06435 [Parabacteroides sp. AF17-28]
MLALTTYNFTCHFIWEECIISYKARAVVLLLFSGLTRAFELIIDNTLAFFLCPFIIIRGGVLTPFVKLVVGFLNTILLTINF